MLKRLTFKPAWICQTVRRVLPSFQTGTLRTGFLLSGTIFFYQVNAFFMFDDFEKSLITCHFEFLILNLTAEFFVLYTLVLKGLVFCINMNRIRTQRYAF